MTTYKFLLIFISIFSTSWVSASFYKDSMQSFLKRRLEQGSYYHSPSRIPRNERQLIRVLTLTGLAVVQYATYRYCFKNPSTAFTSLSLGAVSGISLFTFPPITILIGIGSLFFPRQLFGTLITGVCTGAAAYTALEMKFD